MIRRKPILLLFLIGLLMSWSVATSNAQQVTLLFAGDAMQHQAQLDAAQRDKAYDYSSYFKYLKTEISSADIAVVNLEVTLGGKPYRGYPMFSAPDEFASALKDAGFDIFLTANNHALDRFSSGVKRTINVLDSLGVKHLGTYADGNERERYHPLMVYKNGIRMAFLNYTYGTNGIEAPPPVIVNYIDKEQIKKDVRRARNLGADIIIANLHWGLEYKLIQGREQEDLAAFLVKEGVDLIVGSHPHVIQPSKVLKNDEGNISNLIVYSMGNFVSGMKVANTDGGQVIRVELTKKGFKTSIRSCSYGLVYVYKAATDNHKIDYTLVPVVQAGEKDSGKAIELPADQYKKMMVFSDNARAIFSKYNQSVGEYDILLERPYEELILKIIGSKIW